MLSELLENKDFFRLRTELDSAGNKLSKKRLLYYEIMSEMAFGNEELSNEHASAFLNQYGKQNNDSVNASVLDVMAHNYLQLYQYKEAVEIYGTLIDKYTNVYDSATIAGYQNVKELFGAFENVKPQIVHKTGDCEIKAHRNPFKHLMIPVRCKATEDEFIFDTGANLSTITDSCATKMGLAIIDSDIAVGAAQGQTIQTKLAVADSLYVGDMLFENVVFLVAPAETMTFPQINLEIHGVIGFPVIRQMGEIQLHKDGTVFIPETPKDRKLNNLFFDGLIPIVQAFSDNDTLSFVFDTGAAGSELSRKYYESHKSEVEQKGTLRKGKRGSAGGMTEIEEYVIPDFPYAIGTKNAVLPSMPVLLEEYDYHKSYDGSIGQDIISQFNTLIINFKNMYIDFE
jgi:predicted aspartyl protease